MREAALCQRAEIFRVPFQRADLLKKLFARGQNKKKKRVGQVTIGKEYKLDWLILFPVNKKQDFNLKFVYNYSRITFLVCSQPHDI